MSLLPTPRATRGGSSTETQALLPTPTSRDHKGRNQRDDTTCLPGALIPTPLNSDAGPRGGTTGFGLRDWSRQFVEAQRPLPTPRTQNNENRQSEGYGGKDGNFHGLITGQSSWGQYADAIARWEALTRPAPPPTETGPKGNPRLSPRFSEWLMGLPAGWITDVPGVTRNEALKLAGNGVVPQQAEAALRFLLGVMEASAA